MSRNQFVDEHTINIFKAALPYVGPQVQGGMNVILKANDLMNTFQDMNVPGELSAMGLNNEPKDPELLLTSIRGACLPREAEMIDNMLNFIKARKIFNAYQSYNQNILQAAETDKNKKNSGDNNNGLLDFLMTQLSPEQRSTFEMFNMVMNSMSMDGNHSSGQEKDASQQV